MPADINSHWNGGYAPPPQYVPPPNAPAVNFSGDPFEVADAKTRYAARKFGEYVEQMNAILNLDERTKAQALEAFATTPAARDAAASVEAARAHRDQLAAKVDTERAALATDSDSGAQIAAQREWARHEAQLEAQSNVGQVHATATNLVRNATPQQLNVLAEELPAWLAAKGQTAVAESINEAIAQAAPQLGEARQAHSDAERKVVKLQHNHKVTQNAYKAHRPVDDRLMLDPT
jgi:hypothetical protein